MKDIYWRFTKNDRLAIVMVGKPHGEQNEFELFTYKLNTYYETVIRYI